MNERIQELLEQVGGYGTRALIHPDDVEKFAELIVRECVNICNDIADPCLNRNQDSHQRMAPGASYASKVIKLRFLE